MKKHQLLWFKDLGSAYAAAEMAARQGGKILELFPFGSNGHLFLESKENLNFSSLSEKPTKMAEFSNLSDVVIKAYLSLTNPSMKEDLVIVESNFLGDIFTAANMAVDQGLDILDLRFVRDSSGHSYVMLTGSSASCEKFLKATPSNVKSRRITNPSEGLREFFPR